MTGCSAESFEDGGDESTGEVTLAVAATSSEYKLPASVDPDILDDRETELWARVYRPTVLEPGRRYPLLIFLHGNHPTCGTGSNPRVDDNWDYTSTGTCPPGYTVVPNHDGYGYFAEDLASEEYIVVTINANRGINLGTSYPGDSYLIYARGKLILKHLAQLAEWDRGESPTPASLGVDLTGHIDFDDVGMMGHSRGGEGVRTAFTQYTAAGSPWPARIGTPVNFQGIFEIAPVDGQTTEVHDSRDMPWTVLLPMCDGDLADLQGIQPFDRSFAFTSEDVPSFRASATVWGANHNYFNTEWQQSDSFGCLDHEPLFDIGAGVVGSLEQQLVGETFAANFFRGTVGPNANPAYTDLFDPVNPLPSEVTAVARVDRGYLPSPDASTYRRVEDFILPTGIGSSGLATQYSNVTHEHIDGFVHEHDFTYRAMRIEWANAGSDVYWQTNMTSFGFGVSLAPYDSLDLRVDRIFDDSNVTETTNFSVRLVGAFGALSSPVQIANYLDLVGPVGGPGGRHSMLQTARIPLTAFTGVNLQNVRGVRLTFDDTPSGALLVGSIRATKAAPSASTPKLDLRVRKVNQTPNSMTFRFQVFNREADPIALSSLSMRMWISDSAMSIVADPYYGGHVFNGAGGYAYGLAPLSVSTAPLSPSCSSAPNRIANWTVTAASTDGRTIPGNGGAWVDGQFAVHRANWQNLQNPGDDYSQTPGYQGGVISDVTWPTIYGNDAYFVLYHDGQPVAEYTAAGTPDAQTGQPPSCFSPLAFGGGAASSAAGPAVSGAATPAASAVASTVSTASIVSVSASSFSTLPAGSVDVVVRGDGPFPLGDAARQLVIGSNVHDFSSPLDVDLIVFTLTPAQLNALVDGAPAAVRIGSRRWELGAIDRRTLQP